MEHEGSQRKRFIVSARMNRESCDLVAMDWKTGVRFTVVACGVATQPYMQQEWGVISLAGKKAAA
jgi:hypothetical protein